MAGIEGINELLRELKLAKTVLQLLLLVHAHILFHWVCSCADVVRYNLLTGLKVQLLEPVSSYLMNQVTLCLNEGLKYKLPSAAQASVWSAFHHLRGSKHIMDRWDSFAATALPSQELEESPLLLQLLLDRMLKACIRRQLETSEPTAAACNPISSLERNAIHYMVGFVAVKLLKRYTRSIHA